MRVIKDGAKRKVSTIDSIFVGSGTPTPLPPEDSNLTGLPNMAQKIKGAKSGVNKEARHTKTATTGIHSAKTEQTWVKIGLN